MSEFNDWWQKENPGMAQGWMCEEVWDYQQSRLDYFAMAAQEALSHWTPSKPGDICFNPAEASAHRRITQLIEIISGQNLSSDSGSHR